MLLKTLALVCVFATAQSATIKQRNIPVEVRYDQEKQIVNEVVNEGIKALDEKSTNANKQPEVTEVTKEAVHDLVDVPAAVETVAINAVKTVSENVVVPENEVSSRLTENLVAKTQLSLEEQSQAVKHLPVPEEITEDISLRNANPEQTRSTTPSSLDLSLFQEARDVIANGLKKIRESFKAEEGQSQPLPEQWEGLEKAVDEYLEEEKNKLNLRQSAPTNPPVNNQNFFQNIASGIQNIANNFVQGIQGGGSNGTQGDEGQPGNQGGFQGFVSYFQGGVNNIVNTISNFGQSPTTSNTVLGDPGTGSSTQAPNLISSFVNNVQQFFGGIQGGSQTGGPAGTQGDPGTNGSSTTAQVGGPVQVIQQIGSAIGNFIQGRPPGTSSDTETGPNQNNNFIQNIGNAFQQLNPFRPNGQNGGAAPQSPGQGVQTAVVDGAQQVSNQIQQLIPGQKPTDGTKIEAPSSEQPPKKEETSTPPTAPQQTPSNAAAGKSASDVQTETSETKTGESKITENSESLKEEASDTKEILTTAE